MADAPPPATPTPLDRDVWLACATPLSRVPVVGSQVYYFPHGHSEQCPAQPRAPAHNLFPCTVAAVRLFADPKTDEPFATVDLVPGPHRDPAPAPALHLPDANAAEAAAGFRYYAKQLTQSDANNGGGFSVPRFCAELVFPPLDFEADPPVQKLRMSDPLGRGWDFRHIYRGTPRRHLLTTGWSKFVNAKLLVAGDAVVFMRRADGELLAGIRRAPRYPAVSQQSSERRPRNARARVPPEEVDEAVRLAAEGAPFTVTYYPRQGAGEFVVPKQEVEDALVGAWAPGVQVRMKFLDAEERRSEWINGVVKAVDPSIWRMLEIDWDESVVGSLRNRHVNAWQVELVGYPPILKKLKISEKTLPPMCSGDVGMADPLLGPDCENMVMLLASPIPAGMQGARHIGLTELPSPSPTVLTTKQFFPPSSSGGSSEVVNPEAGSPPNNSVNIRPSEERRSIQLFGATITSPVQSATNGSSEEVSQAPDAAVDGTAHEDASATSLLDCQLTIGKDDGHDRDGSKQEA